MQATGGCDKDVACASSAASTFAGQTVCNEERTEPIERGQGSRYRSDMNVSKL